MNRCQLLRGTLFFYFNRSEAKSFPRQSDDSSCEACLYATMGYQYPYYQITEYIIMQQPKIWLYAHNEQFMIYLQRYSAGEGAFKIIKNGKKVLREEWWSLSGTHVISLYST